MKTKPYILSVTMLLGIAIFLSAPIYASDTNPLDKKSKEDTFTYGSTYSAETLKKSMSVMDQSISWSTAIEDASKTTQTGVSDKVGEKTGDRVDPNLKKKTGAGESAAKSGNTVLIDGDANSFERGKGDKGPDGGVFTDNNGHTYLIEYFNGKRYIWAGFDGQPDNSGDSMRGAIDLAKSGDSILVKAGTYNTGVLYLRSGIKIYGGYNDSGIRDINHTPTIINGAVNMDCDTDVELNGFTIMSDTYNVLIQMDGGSNITIKNNSLISNYKRINTGNPNYDPGYAIKINSGGGIEIANNRITAEYAYWGWYGDDVKLTNNDICGQTKQWKGSQLAEESDSGMHKGPPITLIKTTPTQTIPARPYDIRTGPSMLFDKETGEAYYTGNMGDMFKAIIKNKDGLAKSSTGQLDPALVQQLILNKIPGEGALAVPVNEPAGSPRASDMKIALILANIMLNPTDDQKKMLDSVESILSEAEDLAEEMKSDEMKQVEEEFTRTVSVLFLAQALPDLLRQGDATSIKEIFSDISTAKDIILLKYREAVTPYYVEMASEFARNIDALKLGNILSNEFTEQAILKLSPKDIDAIVKKLKEKENQGIATPEMKALLAREADLRAVYITPNQKLLEESMTSMLKQFTQKVYSILYASGAITAEKK